MVGCTYTPSQWAALKDSEVAEIIRPWEPATVLGLDATQRWFHLGRHRDISSTGMSGYLRSAAAATAGLCTMLGDHGCRPLFFPLQIPLNRGADYLLLMLERGIPDMLAAPEWAALRESGQVGFYGPEPQLPSYVTQPSLLGALEALKGQLINPNSGVGRPPPWLYMQLQFNEDPDRADWQNGETVGLLEQVGKLHTLLHRSPTRGEILAAYYRLPAGSSLPPIRLVLSGMLGDLLGRMVPPLLGGREEYYFPLTLLDLDRATLRSILYDLLWGRSQPQPQYAAWSEEHRGELTSWYKTQRNRVLGLGSVHPKGEFWWPT